MKFTKEDASEMGRRGAQKTNSRRLSPDRIERELGPLVTIEDAKRRADRMMLWSASSRIPVTAASACVRALDLWMRAKESEASFEEVDRLREAVDALRKERDGLRRDVTRLQAEVSRWQAEARQARGAA